MLRNKLGQLFNKAVNFGSRVLRGYNRASQIGRDFAQASTKARDIYTQFNKTLGEDQRIPQNVKTFVGKGTPYIENLHSNIQKAYGTHQGIDEAIRKSIPISGLRDPVR